MSSAFHCDCYTSASLTMCLPRGFHLSLQAKSSWHLGSQYTPSSLIWYHQARLSSSYSIIAMVTLLPSIFLVVASRVPSFTSQVFVGTGVIWHNFPSAVASSANQNSFTPSDLGLWIRGVTSTGNMGKVPNVEMKILSITEMWGH